MSVGPQVLTGVIIAIVASCAGCSAGDRLGDGPSGPAGLQLVWPTAEEIRRSSVGWAAGGAVNGPPGNVDRRFLRPYWHRCAVKL